MRSFSRALAALALASAASALAGSIVQAPPHDPSRARRAVESFVALIDGNDYEAYSRKGTSVLVYTDDQGHVIGEEETRDFLASMNGLDGHLDRAPIRIESIRPLVRDRYSPVYLVSLERSRWFPRREEDLNGLIPEEPEGYRSSSETWLAGFSSDDLLTFREVRELWRLTRTASDG